jgi:hypothetical protein
MRTPAFLSGAKGWIALAAVLVASTVGATAAVASVSTTVPVTTYTGCLSTVDGHLSSLAPGVSPLHACQPGERLVHLSGLNGITAGTGLVGSGGGTGTPALALDPAYQLPQHCANGQVATAGGTNTWRCANPTLGTYSAGGGLSLSPSRVFSIKSAYSLPQSCALGESPVLNARGTWSCAGLALAGQTCPNGQFTSGIDKVGGLTCATPPSYAGPELWVTEQFAPRDTPQNSTVTVATLSLPAGTYLLQANGVGEGDTVGVHDVWLNCHFDGANTPSTEAIVRTTDGEGSFSLTDVRFIAAGDIHLLCLDGAPHTHVQEIVMTALNIGPVH